MRAAMAELIEERKRRNFGVQLQNLDGTGDLINHLIWADNIFLIGNSRRQLAEMFAQMTQTIQRYKMHWKESSLKFLVCGNDAIEDNCDEEDIHCFVQGSYNVMKKVLSMEALGVKLDTTIHGS